jgi:hypothetical protein
VKRIFEWANKGYDARAELHLTHCKSYGSGAHTDINDNPVYDVYVTCVFPGYYIMSNERTVLEAKKSEYENKLKCVNKKLGND